MYGNVAGYRYEGKYTHQNHPTTHSDILITDISENTVHRKIDLCKSILDVYNTIDPGRASQRMNIIFELNCANIIDMKNKLSKSLINKNNAMVCEA